MIDHHPLDINPETPMRDTPFYKWIQLNPCNILTDAMCGYFGFDTHDLKGEFGGTVPTDEGDFLILDCYRYIHQHAMGNPALQ